MENENIKVIIKELQHLMYGYNYQVTFGMDIFEECTNLDDFNLKLKEFHSDSRPETITPKLINATDFWQEIDACFAYRGDESGGLSLSEKKEIKLTKSQTKYKHYINQFINEGIKIYYYPDEQGIPGYPVYWDYRFILFVKDNKCLFVYGSASD